jgi:hypothetical protein
MAVTITKLHIIEEGFKRNIHWCVGELVVDQAAIQRLVCSPRSENRKEAVRQLAKDFLSLPNKPEAWRELHWLTQDEENDVRWSAAEALGSVFRLLPDPQKIDRDMFYVPRDLGSAFIQVPYKDQAWLDLHRLVRDENSGVRWSAAVSLGSAFPYAPEKNRAWQDLHSLAQDENSKVRAGSAYAMGSAFSELPNKSQAWMDLHSLAQDEDSEVRMFANHSLGRASTYRATKGDNSARRRHLEKAVAYFKASSEESEHSPGRFCNSFYNTYIAMNFKGAGQEEVKSYRNKANEVVERSAYKVELGEAVNNLASALEKSHSSKDRSVQEIAGELNTFRWYCEKAAEHMAAAEQNAPGAVKLMRAGNPILDDRIQATLAEIQEVARTIDETTQGSGTVYKEPGTELLKAAKGLSTKDLSSIQNCSSRIVEQLKKLCSLLPAEDKEEVWSAIEEIGQEAEFPEKLERIETALLYLSPKMDAIREKKKIFDLHLKNLEFAICKLNFRTGNTKRDLIDIKNVIEKLQIEIEAQGLSKKELANALDIKDRAIIEELTRMQELLNREVRDIAERDANKQDAKLILQELEKLERSKDRLRFRDALEIISSIAKLSQFIISTRIW